MKTPDYESVKNASFDRFFREIAPEEIPTDVFTLAGKVYPVITGGTKEHYNSMTGSGGGFGVFFKKPATWCIIRRDRYTLELIRQWQTYTMSYFGNENKEQVIFLGTKSGRDSDKMKEVKLNAIQTPAGNISFEEAGLIIECKLTQITMPHPDDFCTPEAKEYIKEAYKTPDDYREYVFGEITHVWVKRTTD